MPRVVIQFNLAATAPPVVAKNGLPSAFGRWIGERIAHTAVEWPGVEFHHVEVLPEGVRVALVSPPGIPSAAVGVAVARALRSEIHAAALRSCGLQCGSAIWGKTLVFREG
jgi:hypothetical protein